MKKKRIDRKKSGLLRYSSISVILTCILPLKDDLHFKSSFDVSDEHDKSLRRQSPDPEIQKYQGEDKIEAFSLSLKLQFLKYTKIF